MYKYLLFAALAQSFLQSDNAKLFQACLLPKQQMTQLTLSTVTGDSRIAYLARASDERYDRGKYAFVSHLQFLAGRGQLMLKRHLGIIMPRQRCKQISTTRATAI